MPQLVLYGIRLLDIEVDQSALMASGQPDLSVF